MLVLKELARAGVIVGLRLESPNSWTQFQLIGKLEELTFYPSLKSGYSVSSERGSASFLECSVKRVELTSERVVITITA